ncbi:MAG: transglutaminase domain-containing protein [Christensenellales bacterium]
MSRLRERLPGALGGALLTLLCAWALALPLLRAFLLAQEGGHALLLLSGLSLALLGLDLLPERLRRLAWAGSLLLLSLLGYQSGAAGALLALGRALLEGAPLLGLVTLYSDMLIWLGLLLCLLYARLLVRGEPLFSAPLLLSSGLMMWFSGPRQGITDYLPMILALPLLFVSGPQGEGPASMAPRPWRHLLRALPVALVILLAAFLLTPPFRQTDPALEAQADKWRQTINDYFFFTDSRENFSLAWEGYQPMGEEGLGGKPVISDVPVMAVTTGKRVYLRGTVLDLYNGRQWFDSLSNERYGFTSARFAGLRAGLFDGALPAQGDRLPQQEASVRLLAPLPSTLFLPQRLRGLQTGEGLVPYFNSSTELFVTRSLQPEDSYSLRYEPYIAGSPETDALARLLRGRLDPGADSLPATYLTLPGHLQPDGQVTMLAQRIVGTQQDPYQKGLLIRDYLKTHYAYSLEVPEAPSNLDFAAHFLFETKKGYCTYFATAMTVLARAAGLSSRYVEGFVADAGKDGAPSILTGQQGHAWTEIYIPALGWVTFDATATTGSQPPPPEAPSPTPPPSSPSPSPESPENSQAPEETPSPAPSQPPEGEAPATPTPAPPDENSETPEPDAGPQASPPRIPWLLLLLLALAGLFVQRMRATEPGRLAGKAASPAEALMIHWRALMNLRVIVRLPMRPSETLREYALRTSPEDPDLLRLADIVGAVLYGRRGPGAEQLSAARAQYLGAFEALTPFYRALAVLRRVALDGRERLLMIWTMIKSGPARIWRRARKGRG